MPKKKISTLENDVLNDICAYLQIHKIFFWRSNNVPVHGKNNGGKFAFRSLPKWTPKGVPDIIAVIHGVAVGIEVKRGGDRPGMLRPEQADFGLKMKMAGGVYFVARSVDDVRRNLDMYADKFPQHVFAHVSP